MERNNKDVAIFKRGSDSEGKNEVIFSYSCFEFERQKASIHR